MTEAEILYSERVTGIIKDIEQTQKKKMKKCVLLKKYPSDKDRDFIQKYSETKISVKSFELSKLSYILAGIAIVLAVLVTISPPNPAWIPYYGIALFALFVLFIWVSLFEKGRWEDIIIAIESDKLTSQKTDNPEPTIYNSEGWYHK